MFFLDRIISVECRTLNLKPMCLGGLPDWVLHSGQKLQASVFSSRLSIAIHVLEYQVVGREGSVRRDWRSLHPLLFMVSMTDGNQFFLEPSRNSFVWRLKRVGVNLCGTQTHIYWTMR